MGAFLNLLKDERIFKVSIKDGDRFMLLGLLAELEEIYKALRENIKKATGW